MDADFAAQIVDLESELCEKYRRRTEADINDGIRYAVFPLSIFILWD